MMFNLKQLTNEEYAISANAVLGIRDSGKTYTATKAAEELFDSGIPFIALDPIGVWGSLRIPGHGKGYPVVVAGGRHGDLPLTVKNAGPIVRAAMEANVSLVIDLFSRDLSKADWRRIVRDTVETLLHENEEFGLRHVFIEEAAEFVPQRVQDGQVFAAVEKLVRMGGNSKLGCTLINQRSADLNKSVLELCANVFVHRQKGKNTLLDLRKWFDMLELTEAEQADIGKSLPSLESGHCWALLEGSKSPIFLKVPHKNSQHPDRRTTVAKADKRKPVPAPTFVAGLLTKWAQKEKPTASPKPEVNVKIRQNLTESNTERHLRDAQDISRNKGFAEGQKSVRDMIPAILQAQHVASFEAGWRTAIDKFRGLVAGMHVNDIPLLECVRTKEIRTLLSQHVPPGTNVPKGTFRDIPARRQTNGAAAPDGTLTGPQKAMLGVLAWWEALGHPEPTRAQVAARCGWKVTAGHLNNVSGQLRSAGLIDYPKPGRFGLTAEGRAVAPEPTSATLLESIHTMLTGPQKAVLDTLLRRGRRLPKDDLCEELGWGAHAGHANNVLGQMRSMEILSRARGDIELQEWVQ